MSISLSLSDLGKSPFIMSTGEWAQLANGSVTVSYGDTVVLAAACMSKEVKTTDFFPLTVEYQQRTYAMGKIPGGFIKREGRPKDTEILGARLIDRPLRPLFPKGLFNEVQIIAMVLSSDGKNDPDVMGINAASAALFISDIPFYEPVGAVRVAKSENGFIVNPVYEERENSPLDLVIAGTGDKIVMLEGDFREIAESEVLEAIKFAGPFIKDIISLQKQLREKAGKVKKAVNLYQLNENLYNIVKNKVSPQLENIYGIVDKQERDSAITSMLDGCLAEIEAGQSGIVLAKDKLQSEVKTVFLAVEEEFVRRKILEEEKRPDGRSLHDIRPIECSVRVLPRTHGSAIFTRGHTQSLAVVTLGTSSDMQYIEALQGDESKHFMLHYSFPPFSVGEIKPLRGPSRREIGHGALAEKSLSSVMPSRDDFPYTIRVVSEILESNGSSSMATVCAASLSLMDAGVPIKEPVAGIAIGLIKDGEKYKLLTDIAGLEDHYGDMDFKVAGTNKGLVAVQMDTKIGGLDYKIIEEALTRAKEARSAILEKMNAALALPREVLSKYAPKIKSFAIDIDKIGTVIGPGGKTIRKISRDNNVTVDIEDEGGIVSVVAETEEDLAKAIKQINNLIREIEVGEVFDVKIERITNFGAFCEIAPGKDGLIHISEVSDQYVKDISSVLKEGDIVRAKVIKVDPQGKIALSMKQVE